MRGYWQVTQSALRHSVTSWKTLSITVLIDLVIYTGMYGVAYLYWWFVNTEMDKVASLLPQQLSGATAHTAHSLGVQTYGMLISGLVATILAIVLLWIIGKGIIWMLITNIKPTIHGFVTFCLFNFAWLFVWWSMITALILGYDGTEIPFALIIIISLFYYFTTVLYVFITATPTADSVRLGLLFSLVKSNLLALPFVVSFILVFVFLLGPRLLIFPGSLIFHGTLLLLVLAMMRMFLGTIIIHYAKNKI